MSLASLLVVSIAVRFVCSMEVDSTKLSEPTMSLQMGTKVAACG